MSARMHPENELIPQLFRSEFAKMVAVISRQFGLQYIEIAEDIVSETFLQAAETWDEKGIPDNPPAWLYTVAKRKTLHHFRRNKLFDDKIAPGLRHDAALSEPEELSFSLENIRDSQLQMLFAVCNPVIVNEAQIGLALRILCGFGIDEIAQAFLTGKDTINKRLYRAKEKLRTEQIGLEMPDESDIPERLGNVLHIIYLLFNEGYYSTTQNQVLRKELCVEALRLGVLLTEFEQTNLPETNALLALMCYHASRFSAREGEDQSPVLYEQQNKELWDQELIGRGNYYWTLCAQGEVTSYHLEARIAYWHCRKEASEEKWEKILQLYNRLLQINYSPSVALNRTYALYKVKGAEAAIIEAEKLRLESNHFYFTLLGELYREIDPAKARKHFEQAYELAKTGHDREIILRKINA